mgnify:CR=1 FL=1
MPISKRSFYKIIAVLLIAGFFYYFWQKSQGIQTVSPSRGHAIRAVYATGTVEPEVMIPIAPRIGARLIELSADEGDKVAKGSDLAKLESADLYSKLIAAKSKEVYAESEFKRQESLFKRGAGARHNVEQAESEWKVATAETAAVEAELAYMHLTSPVDGKIIRRDGEIGEYIAVNQPIFWLAQDLPLRISAEVDEEDISEVKPGQKVVIRADAFPDQIFHGNVQQITPKGDPVSRSYRVRIELKHETPFKIGMTAETNIIISEREDALLIPSSAVQESSVWLMKNSKLIKQKVSIGARRNDKTEITDGITENDKIVLNYADGLISEK